MIANSILLEPNGMAAPTSSATSTAAKGTQGPWPTGSVIRPASGHPLDGGLCATSDIAQRSLEVDGGPAGYGMPFRGALGTGRASRAPESRGRPSLGSPHAHLAAARLGFLDSLVIYNRQAAQYEGRVPLAAPRQPLTVRATRLLACRTRSACAGSDAKSCHPRTPGPCRRSSRRVVIARNRRDPDRAWLSAWLQDSAVFVVSQLLSGVAGWILVVIVARKLGPADFGLFSGLYATAQTAAIVVDFGLISLLLRDFAGLKLSERLDQRAGPRVVALLQASFTLNVAVGAVVVTGSVVVAAILGLASPAIWARAESRPTRASSPAPRSSRPSFERPDDSG